MLNKSWIVAWWITNTFAHVCNYCLIFSKVSQIIDVDIVPETCRRVRLLKHGSDKPLGFYIRDGTSVKVTANGIEKQPGIFISRLVPGGLAESTGLLAVNDEVLEVNGIEVHGKTLDQVSSEIFLNQLKSLSNRLLGHRHDGGEQLKSNHNRKARKSANSRNAKTRLVLAQQPAVVGLTSITSHEQHQHIGREWSRGSGRGGRPDHGHRQPGRQFGSESKWSFTLIGGTRARDSDETCISGRQDWVMIIIDG